MGTSRTVARPGAPLIVHREVNMKSFSQRAKAAGLGAGGLLCLVATVVAGVKWI